MRSSVPLGHKLIAVVIAAATAFGLYAFLRYHDTQEASAALLSFDSVAAQQLDPNLSRAPHPAVVLGQSILSDSVVATLVPRADPAASSTVQAIGEFRARLELTQPATGLLLVRYRDPDPAQAAANANAVAKALAGWTPASPSNPHPAANIQPAPNPAPQIPGAQDAPAPAPIPAPTPASTPAASPAAAPIPAPASGAPQHIPGAELAAALGEVHAQLSAAGQHAGPESSFRSEHDRQRYLESQVRAAQQKLYDLRRKLPDAGSATGARTPLDVVQHALALFWPSAAGINTAGTSEAQLKYEREQLTRDIDIVEQQQQAAQRAEAADSASTEVQALPAAPPTTQPQAAPAPAPAASVQSPSASLVPVNPLHLQRAAALPAPVAWWPAALAGCLCGLLYWGIAIARYRALRDSDDELDDEDDEVDLPEKSTRSMYGLSGIDAPVRAASRDEWIEAYPAETSLRKHASFSFDQESDSASASDQRSDQPPSPEPIQHSTEDTVPDDMPEPAVAPSQTDKPETASDADAVAPPRTPEEQDEVSQEEHDQEKHVQEEHVQEKHSENTNSWEDEIRRNLSQTTFARMLDPKPIAEDVADGASASKGPAREAGDPPSKPSRLVG